MQIDLMYSANVNNIPLHFFLPMPHIELICTEYFLNLLQYNILNRSTESMLSLDIMQNKLAMFLTS